MDEFEKEALLISMERQTTDEGKMSMAKRFVVSNALTVNELAEILSQFHYDSSRKELITLAKDQLKDPDNLSVIYDTFRIEQERLPQDRLSQDRLPQDRPPESLSQKNSIESSPHYRNYYG